MGKWPDNDVFAYCCDVYELFNIEKSCYEKKDWMLSYEFLNDERTAIFVEEKDPEIDYHRTKRLYFGFNGLNLNDQKISTQKVLVRTILANYTSGNYFGFQNQASYFLELVLTKLNQLEASEENSGCLYEVFFCGHSIGGSIAATALINLHIRKHLKTKSLPANVTMENMITLESIPEFRTDLKVKYKSRHIFYCITHGAAMFGNQKNKEYCINQKPNYSGYIFNVIHEKDPVPKLFCHSIQTEHQDMKANNAIGNFLILQYYNGKFCPKKIDSKDNNSIKDFLNTTSNSPFDMSYHLPDIYNRPVNPGNTYLDIINRMNKAMESLKKPYVCTEYVGEGSYGWVVKANNNDNLFAIKKLKSNYHNNERNNREFKNLSKINNEHVVTFVEHFCFETKLYLVFEFCLHGSLDSYITKNQLEIKEIREILFQLLLGLSAIHSKNIIHRDIKPANILVTRLENGNICYKISDFGSSVQYEGPLELLSAVGTPLYTSPEISLAEENDFIKVKLCEKTDIFSLGAVILFCIKKENPWLSDKFENLIESGFNEMLATEYKNIPEDLKEMLLLMLQRKSYKRYYAESLLLHPFIRRDFPKPTDDKESLFDQESLLAINTINSSILSNSLEVFNYFRTPETIFEEYVDSGRLFIFLEDSIDLLVKSVDIFEKTAYNSLVHCQTKCTQIIRKFTYVDIEVEYASYYLEVCVLSKNVLELVKLFCFYTLHNYINRHLKYILNLLKCIVDGSKTVEADLECYYSFFELFVELFVEVDDYQINTECKHILDLFTKGFESLMNQGFRNSGFFSIDYGNYDENCIEFYKTLQQLIIDIKGNGLFFKIDILDKCEILIIAVQNIMNASNIEDAFAAVYKMDIDCFKEKKFTEFIESLHTIALNNIVHLKYILKAIDVYSVDYFLPHSLAFYELYGASSDPDLINLLESMRIMENSIIKDKRITNKISKDIKLCKRHFDIRLFLNYLSAPKPTDDKETVLAMKYFLSKFLKHKPMIDEFLESINYIEDQDGLKICFGNVDLETIQPILILVECFIKYFFKILVTMESQACTSLVHYHRKFTRILHEVSYIDIPKVEVEFESYFLQACLSSKNLLELAKFFCSYTLYSYMSRGFINILNIMKCITDEKKKKDIYIKKADLKELKLLFALLEVGDEITKLDDNQINTKCEYLWNLFVKAAESSMNQKNVNYDESCAELYKTLQQLIFDIKGKGIFLKIDNWKKIEILILALLNVNDANNMEDVFIAVYEKYIDCFKEKCFTDFMSSLTTIAINNIAVLKYRLKFIDFRCFMDYFHPPSFAFSRVFQGSTDPDLVNLFESMKIMEISIYKDKRITDKISKDIKPRKRRFHIRYLNDVLNIIDIRLFLNYFSIPSLVFLTVMFSYSVFFISLFYFYFF